jgi:hypothetical protein
MQSESSRFVVRAARSQPIGDCNDDACGSSPRRLWVLDGATGVSDRRWTRFASDASWLAHTASDLLRDPQWDGQPLAAALSGLEAQLRAAFIEAVACEGLSQAGVHEMPSACLGIVQLLGDEIEVACVGDISVVVQAPGRLFQVFTDSAAEPFSRRTLHAWQRARASTHGANAMWEEACKVIRENRSAMNQPGGYRVVHPVLAWAQGVQVHRLPAVAGTRILLASDGLWRLVDLFREMSPQALMQAIEYQGIGRVLARLRAMEADDPACEAFARVKPGDDATGMLAELTFAGGAFE